MIDDGKGIVYLRLTYLKKRIKYREKQ